MDVGKVNEVQRNINSTTKVPDFMYVEKIYLKLTVANNNL